MLSLAACIVCIVVLESAARLIMPPTHFHGIELDNYGFRIRANTSEEHTFLDPDGSSIRFISYYFENGFKRGGSIDTKKRRS